ncbi:MAG TPA: DUF1150 family protein [Rhizomicrobium sp.]|jgi:hypothetical protein|nr:DUF1150 family protein [Rhizomicrobium sp.]
MTERDDIFESDEAAHPFDPARIAYIKPTGTEEARRLGIIPPGIQLPEGVKLYVLHAMDGSVLGYTDDWDAAYGAAVQNELTPLSVH